MVALATVVCFIIASPFVMVGEGGIEFGSSMVQGYDFSGGLRNIADKSGLNPHPKDQEPQLPEIIGAIINAGLSVIGVVCLVIIIIAGYRWMMAEGSEETITKARHSIKSAAIGVIIVLASYAITYYVINTVLPSGGGGGDFDQYRPIAPTEPGLVDMCEDCSINCEMLLENECSGCSKCCKKVYDEVEEYGMDRWSSVYLGCYPN